MKVIDLLNKIANGEEINKFKYYGGTYIYDKKTQKYWYEDMWFDLDFCNLNDKVEVIEEEIKEYTSNFLKAWKPVKSQFGKLFDEIIRIKTELGLNFPKEEKEDNKIEKLTEIQKGDFLELPTTLDLMNKINELIDEINKLKENK